MPSDLFYFDEGTLTVTVNGTDITAAEARGITMTPAADHNRFTGPDSILVQEKKRSNFRVDVEMEIAEFDEVMLQTWLQGNATPDAQAGVTTTSTTVNDDHGVADFNVTAEQPMTSGDYKLKAVAVDTDFPEMPAIDGTEGEYSTRQLTGQANEIVFTNEST